MRDVCKKATEKQNNHMLSALQCFSATGGIKDSQIFVLFVRKWRNREEGKETQTEKRMEEGWCSTITAVPPRRMKQEGQPSWDEAAVYTQVLNLCFHQTYTTHGALQGRVSLWQLQNEICVCAPRVCCYIKPRQIYELAAFNRITVYIIYIIHCIRHFSFGCCGHLRERRRRDLFNITSMRLRENTVSHTVYFSR